ncbi:MAG: 30S ribosome-binding factor RbfA [Acidobacteria bacterium]|nr:30S ribosome-binding factor RbfA [Acidobacteriota bacterium]
MAGLSGPMTHGARTDRVGERIRAEISTLLLRRVREPAVDGVTITHVEVTRDLQIARVFYRVLAEAHGRREAARALRRARGFLRRELAARLRLRRVPELTFLHDDSVEQQDRIARLFDELRDDGLEPAEAETQAAETETQAAETETQAAETETQA